MILKKITLSGTLAAILYGSAMLLASAQAINELPPIIQQSLSLGSSGDDVKSLQRYLAQYPEIYPEKIINGFFGKLTEAAVKRWQQKYGLEPAGSVGPMTRAKLKMLREQASAPTPATPAPAPKPQPAPAPIPEPVVSPVVSGTGIVENGQIITLSSGTLIYGGGSGQVGRGYLLPGEPVSYIAEMAGLDYSNCEKINSYGYRGVSDICKVTAAGNLKYEKMPKELRVYDKNASVSNGYQIFSCYQGIAILKQGDKYIAIDPEDVDGQNRLHYRYWVDNSGTGDFSPACQSAAAPKTGRMAFVMDAISSLLKKIFGRSE